MRPEKLIMSAFGPYADKQELELSKLGTEGIYLITGDTGAGKTTVFDAIVYALYGEASGENRDATMFRSKYALPETPTFVELSFYYGDKIYLIRRNPEYVRPKSRGDGFTTEKASAELHCPDGKIYSGVSDVNKKVIEIMGVDRNQFTRTAMIAQGDFMKLLLASTPERKEIFRKLFKTQKYAAIQEKLKNLNAGLLREYETVTGNIAQYVNGIIVSEDDVLSISVRQAKNGLLPVDEIIELLEILTENDKKLLEKTESEAKSVDERLEEITKIITRIHTVNKAKEEMLFLEEHLAELTDKKISALKELKAREKDGEKTEQIIRRIASLEAGLTDYDELDKGRAELEKLVFAIKSNDAMLEKKNAFLVEGTAKCEKAESELKSLENTGELRIKTEAWLSELNIKKASIDSFITDRNELERLKGELAVLQADYKKKAEIAIEKKLKYENLNKAYLDAQAGILAEGLRDNMPCPVCGSLQHPHPAEKALSVPTEDELESSKKEADIAQLDVSEASAKSGKMLGTVAEKESAVMKTSEELFGSKSSEEIKKATDEKILELNKTLTDIKRAEERKTELEEKIPVARQKIEAVKNDIIRLNEAAAVNKSNLNELEKRLTELKDKLSFDSKLQALKVKSDLEQERNSLQQALVKAKENVSNTEKDIAAAAGKIEENKKFIAQFEISDIQAEEQKQAELKEKKAYLTELQKNVHSRMQANLASLENIRHKCEEVTAVEKKLSTIRSLSETANGTLGGKKEKIMLETYIQTNYFDSIIHKANTRLMVMTDGQYELQRRKVADNFKTQSGLDLDVIDHYNGSVRSVKSLSGGEAFKASLSLALGLSDEIQSAGGGIKLDTMFVDEGFGSLDDESLSQAINALSGLANGNRLVGIISHVNELKQRIDKQIIVKKDKSGGSKASVCI